MAPRIADVSLECDILESRPVQTPIALTAEMTLVDVNPNITLFQSVQTPIALTTEMPVAEVNQNIPLFQIPHFFRSAVNQNNSEFRIPEDNYMVTNTGISYWTH
jgi:cytochrome c-type biogenesis protein CcmE